MTNTPAEERWIERGILELEFFANQGNPLQPPGGDHSIMPDKIHISEPLCHRCAGLNGHHYTGCDTP